MGVYSREAIARLRPVYNDHADVRFRPVMMHETLDQILQRLKRQSATDHQMTTDTHKYIQLCRRTWSQVSRVAQKSAEKHRQFVM